MSLKPSPLASSLAKRWVIIPVEVQVRDLMGRLVTACVAASRNHDVLIGHDQVIRRNAPFLPKGILFDKALGRKDDKKLKRYHRLGFRLTAFDEESTGFYTNPSLQLVRRLSHEMLERAAYWFAMSDQLRDITREFYPGHDDKIVTTGLPRSDAFRPQFREFFQPQVDEILDQHGNFILFCSNFGYVNHGMSDTFLKGQDKRGQQLDAEQEAYRIRNLQQGKQNFDAFVEMLPQLRQWFPDHKLIIRPHPAENHEFYNQHFKDHPGIEVVHEGTAAPWILASKILVHHGCTTGIEAGLMAKPHVMYAPFKDHHHETDIMKTIATMAKDLETLRESMGHVLLEGGELNRDIAGIEQWYANLEGRLVGEHIVDYFETIDIKPDTLSKNLSLLRFMPRHLVAQYWPRSKRDNAYRKRKYPGTTLGEMSRMTNIIGEKIGADLEISEVFPQLYHIRTK